MECAGCDTYNGLHTIYIGLYAIYIGSHTGVTQSVYVLCVCVEADVCIYSFSASLMATRASVRVLMIATHDARLDNV